MTLWAELEVWMRRGQSLISHNILTGQKDRERIVVWEYEKVFAHFCEFLRVVRAAVCHWLHCLKRRRLSRGKSFYVLIVIPIFTHWRSNSWVLPSIIIRKQKSVKKYINWPWPRIIGDRNQKTFEKTPRISWKKVDSAFRWMCVTCLIITTVHFTISLYQCLVYQA